MFSNYLKVALRNLLRHKIYSAINIVGLAIGLSSSIVILLLVRQDLSFDRFHSKADRICRLCLKLNTNANSSYTTYTHGPAGPALAADFPEVAGYVRFESAAFRRDYLLNYEDKNFYIEKAYYTDPSFFDIFDFELLSGDPRTALKDPRTAVMTEQTAAIVFGEDNPVGKLFRNESGDEYKVTGILKNVPRNSHLQFDLLLSTRERMNRPNDNIHGWGMLNFATYVQLEDKTDVEILEKKLPGFVQKYFPNTVGMFEYHLQPMQDVHLRSTDLEENRMNWYKGDINRVYISTVLAFIVLLISCFNFMNLSTARSAWRAREVGIRKVAGAQTSQLIRQFLGESVLISFIALLIAVTALELASPAFNAICDGVPVLDYSRDWHLLAGLLALAIAVGLFSGIYPAVFLSRFCPVTVLKGGPGAGAGEAFLRKILVVAQFAASVALLSATIIVARQLHYLRTKNPGFNFDQVVLLSFESGQLGESYEALRKELLDNQSIVDVTISSGQLGQAEKYSYNGFAFQGQGSKVHFPVSFLPVDHNFISFYGLEMIEGRAFSADQDRASAVEACIINEALAKKLGWSDIQGKMIGQALTKPELEKLKPVLGIVKNFNYMSLHSAVEPLVMTLWPPSWMEIISVRIKPENIAATLDFIISKCKTHWPGRPPRYSFLDEDIAALYQAEQREAAVLGAFTGLAVFVSCLGLLGLVSFAAESRTREIGVRRVLGASVADIIMLLGREYLVLLSVSILIAWPVAWYVMNRWLQNFAYRNDLESWPFILSGVIALAVAALAVGCQAAQAATANPVDALRYE